MKPEYGIVNSALVHIISVVFINGILDEFLINFSKRIKNTKATSN